MDTASFSLGSLFVQLGLPASEQQIQRFIRQHPLADDTHLIAAPFWTPAQAHFLAEGWQTGWAESIDELDASLHRH